MKLPRFGAARPEAMPTFQAPNIPAPRMVTARNQQFIPQFDPGREFSLGEEKAALYVDLGKQLGTGVQSIIDSMAEAELASAKAGRTKAVTEFKVNASRLPSEVIDADGNKTYPWEGLTQKYVTAIDAYDAKATESMSGKARSEYELWAAQQDSTITVDLNKQEQDRFIDRADSQWIDREQFAVDTRNEDILNQVTSERLKSGFFDSSKVLESHYEMRDAIRHGQVDDFLRVQEINVGKMTEEEIAAVQEGLFESVKMFDHKTASAFAKRIDGLDDLKKEDTTTKQDDRWDGIRTTIISALTPADRLSKVKAFLASPGIEEAIGDDNYKELYDLHNAILSIADVSNEAVLAQISAAIDHFEVTGDGYISIDYLLRENLANRSLKADDWAAFHTRKSDSYTNKVSEYVEIVFTDLDGRMGVTETSTGLLNIAGDDDGGSIDEQHARNTRYTQTRIAVKNEIKKWIAEGTVDDFFTDIKFANYLEGLARYILNQPKLEGSTKASTENAGTYKSYLTPNNADPQAQADEFREFAERYASTGNNSQWDDMNMPRFTRPDGTIIYPDAAGIDYMQKRADRMSGN